MKKTIWKYPFEVNDEVKLTMPKGAEILTLMTQQGQPCIWALVNPDEEQVEKTFEIYGTGHPIDDNPLGERKYIGSFQVFNQALIFHVFEII